MEKNSKYGDKCNFHTLARPQRKAADSQEIGQMLEDSNKKRRTSQVFLMTVAGTKLFNLLWRFFFENCTNVEKKKLPLSFSIRGLSLKPYLYIYLRQALKRWNMGKVVFVG